MVDKITAPALPHATEEYDRQFMERNSNVLRLFFNRLVTTVNGLTGTIEPYEPTIAYGAYDSITQQPMNTNPEGARIVFENVRASNGIIRSPSNEFFTIEKTGIYRMSLTIRAGFNGTGTQFIQLWVAQNQSGLPNSGYEWRWTGTASSQAVTYVWENTYSLTQGNTLSFIMRCTQSNAYIGARTAMNFTPALPSASLAITYVSDV